MCMCETLNLPSNQAQVRAEYADDFLLVDGMPLREAQWLKLGRATARRIAPGALAQVEFEANRAVGGILMNDSNWVE